MAIPAILGEEWGKSFDGVPQPQTEKPLLRGSPVRSRHRENISTGTDCFLRVEPNGSRFRVQRILVRGKRRELGLGSPALMTLAEAWEKPLDNRRIATTGDPLEEKLKSKKILTFEEAGRKAHRDGLRGVGSSDAS